MIHTVTISTRSRHTRVPAGRFHPSRALALIASFALGGCTSSAKKTVEPITSATTAAPATPSPVGVPSALIDLGVQAGSPVRDYAHAVIDDGDGGAYVGHLVMRDSLGVLPTRPGDKRLVLEGAEGVYLSHYDADYQRVSRAIIEDIHQIDAIARNSVNGTMYIAGSEHFYPKGALITKLRIARYDPARAVAKGGFADKLLKRLPRRVVGHRIADLAIDDEGDVYVAIGLQLRSETSSKATGVVKHELAVARLSPTGNVRWYDVIDLKPPAQETRERNAIAALGFSRRGHLIVAGHASGAISGSARSHGGLDIFVAALDRKSGASVWSKQFGSREHDRASDIAVTKDGTIVIVGSTAGTLFSDSRGDEDAVIIGLGKDGSVSFREQLGSAKADRFHQVTVSNKEVVLAFGETSGKLALERPSSNPESADRDVLVVAYSGAGLRSWVVQLGTEHDDNLAAAVTAANRGTHVLFDTIGTFKERAGGTGTTGTTGKPNQDLVLVRLRE